MEKPRESTCFAKKVLLFLLVAGLAFVVTECRAEQGLYLSVGLGVHDVDMDAPEVNLGSSLGLVEFGYTMNGWDLKYSHISGIEDRERGHGANVLSINYRWWLK